ncbi:DUF3726 domain-containing protein [Roseovarius sp. MMSF_3281]|uniref:DUF3726 domain-containing protein n=1 Tax=Roseovarius sp. MMSF_3281 TaxID=3046694 RepID=UPI00273DCEB8|nr:DUF3726 domain-containing protein [Roseovarius sp. MMSF_3281]
MSWSLNEIETLSRKAARGAGLSWGLAEEAGKAARWLTAAGLPGPQVLADLLTRNDGAEYEALCPMEAEEGTWVAKGGTLCPLISGAVLCDNAQRLQQGKVSLGRTAAPMLLLPYLDAAARQCGTALTVQWNGTTITLGNAAQTTGNGLDAPMAEKITISPTPVACPAPPVARRNRGDMPADVARRLTAFAERTYAPETEESRLSGAGAGLTDND